MRKSPLLASLAIHVGVIGLLLFIASLPPVVRVMEKLPDHITLFAPRRLSRTQDGGGGQRSPLDASKGQAPPKAVTRVFVPPSPLRPDQPKLPVVQALLEAPDVNIQASQIGDPLGKPGPLSAGPGGPLGIGDGKCCGIGSGDGSKQGGTRPPDYKALGITTYPRILHQEDPEYSEDARKARHQGTVILAIDIGVNGRVSNVRVVRGLGLGLDEKAIEAVQKWIFRPALANGKPVAAPAQVSVTFHLL
jgi:periplasmic protein TonB